MIGSLNMGGNYIINTSLTTPGIIHSDLSGNLNSGLIVNTDISSGAAISYSKLNLLNNIFNSYISTVSSIDNSKLAGNPSSSNTSNAIVLRDSYGNFSAGTIIANLSGNAASATNVEITGTSASGIYYPVFTTSQTSTNAALNVDSSVTPLSYDPSSGAMSVSNILLKGLQAAASYGSAGQVLTTNGNNINNLLLDSKMGAGL